MTHTYNITGMTCSSCVAKAKSELLKLGDVTNAEVQLQSPQATISMQQHIPLSGLQEALSKAGNYKISELNTAMSHGETDTATTGDSYYPIFLIFGYIAAVALLVQAFSSEFSIMLLMQHLMAGFFLVFSFFKLLNVKGFAEGYRTYDVVAKKIPAYGLVYPFIELALGIAYLTGFNPIVTNAVTFILMSVSTIGVAQSLLKKTPFQCACLGTIIKLPLSKVTLFEDVSMAIMSGIVLITLIG